MDKKTVIKWLVGILVNLGALFAIYFTANPKLTEASKAEVHKQDSLDKIAAARFVPSYRKPGNPGFLSKVANEVNHSIASEQDRREARKRKMSRQDTLSQNAKTPVHLLQKIIFDSLKKQVDDSVNFFRKFHNQTAPVLPDEAQWDAFNGIKSTGVYPDSFNLKPGVQVFGWHPYWMGSAYKTYSLSLLSTIAYYGAEINAYTGEITNTHGWETTGLFSKTDTTGCRVELTVINTGDDNVSLLSEASACENLIGNLLGLLDIHGDGICLDFEGVPNPMRKNLTAFVAALHDSLAASAKRKQQDDPGYAGNYSITMVLPCFDWTNGYDVKALAPFVDRFVITGYDYYGAFSKVTGPSAPLSSGLEWNAPDIEGSVDDYLKKGIPPAKLLLGLPYYGIKWQGIETTYPSAGTQFLGFPLYRRIKTDLALREIAYDTASVTAYYISNSTLPVQYWFDDKETLGEKYRWVMRKKIGGVGIWALGYDNGYTELWKTLRDNFARNKLNDDTTYASKFITAFRDTTALPPDKEWGMVAANGHYLIFDNPYVLLFGALGIFAVILLLQVMLDDQPFNEFFSRRLLLFIASSLAGTIVLVLLGLALWSKIPHREIYLLLAGIIGGYLLFRFTQRIIGKKERLP